MRVKQDTALWSVAPASDEPARPTTRPPTATEVIDSLAVLPFANSSGDQDMEYLGDGIADSLLVAGNGFLGLCDGRLLPPKYVRPEPPVYRLLVWLQDILPQVKTGVKKRLTILVRSVEILNQTQ